MEGFHFSHSTKTRGEEWLQAFFSAIPGTMSWAILIGLTALSVYKPFCSAVIIIAIDIYWLMRIFYMTIFLILAYAVLAIEKETNWIERCRFLEKGSAGLDLLQRKKREAFRYRKFKRYFALKNQDRELRQVIAAKVEVPAFNSIYHIVLIAAAKEGPEILEPGLRSLIASQFPASRMIPVLAIEARAGEKQEQMARALREKYKHHFFDFLVTVHPDGVPGEARVKGANVTYAAKQAAEFLKGHQIPFENVILSCFDADTVASPQYFAALTYHFMRHPERERASFQPIPVYHNNIYDAQAFARVLETGSSFFQLVEATNPEKLVTFSSHSMSFKALVEIGYWPVDMISDDSAIFWKALIHYGGNYHVVPMYVTLSMDVVMAGTVWNTLLHVYKQKRRWAWGVENFPIVMRAFVQEKRISFFSKFRYTLKLLEMHISWATLGFILTFIGWLPGIFASHEFSNSVFFYNSARISGFIFNMASATLLVTVILSLLMLPKSGSRYPFLKKIVFALEWLLIPFIFTFLSCLPALDAQTRLARGHGMEFWVTEKKRKN